MLSTSRAGLLWIALCCAAAFALTSCGDSSSVDEPGAVARTETDCANGVDDDGDGATDCSDGDCSRGETCQVARCKGVCTNIMKCDGIVEACTDQELASVRDGCKQTCEAADQRGEILMADGVPCMVIGTVFLQRVQGNGICLGDDAAADGA